LRGEGFAGHGRYPVEAEHAALFRRSSPPQQVADEDAALIARVGRGDAAAFRTIVDRHATALHRLAWRMLMDAVEAEDVVQEAFTRLWTGAPRWRVGEGRVGGWLHRVCANLCLDRLRRRPTLDLAEAPDSADAAPLAPAQMDAVRAGDTVSACLAALSDRHRAALVLTYYESLPNARAAEMMELDIKAFESLLLRARAALKARLIAHGIGVADLVGAEGEAA
jgi:RNA polymerase sigma factor (sigma-70 family)